MSATKPVAVQPPSDPAERVTAEVDYFSKSNLWKGGFIEGDPLDPLAPSTYSFLHDMGYASLIHMVYRLAIKPYVNSDTVALEIGPGRGAWSRGILTGNPKHLHVADVLSAEHNCFWENVGRRDNVTYHQVKDCSLSFLPDNSVDYVFSFGCFCHLSPTIIAEYMKTFGRVLRPGGRGFVMYADYDKWNEAMANRPAYSLGNAFSKRRTLPMRIAYKLWSKLFDLSRPQILDKNQPDDMRPGRWFHVSQESMADMARNAGLKVITADMDILFRDPIIAFEK
ncbi:class I SAM-dependent methyltransferase [Niveispirillum irakense]|uniref:class I SAM-dependent methyltransferase n=1 Tax=Niveispirillum irakense TaxID=34011 RepID=UPI0005511AB8|nr:class I SAM-dependent methyltransferase [Niveispirillum irakense]